MSDTTSQANQRRLVYARLIHGTGALLAVASVVMALCSIVEMIIGTIHGGTGTLGSFGALFAILIVGLFFGVIFITGRRMYKDINKNTISDFAFLFAVFIAVIFYHSLPVHFPEVIANYFGYNSTATQNDLTYRNVWAFVTWYLFWRLIKSYLMQVFELGAVSAPNPSVDSDIPQFPKRSPLVEL